MYINEFKWKESEDKECKDLKKDKVKSKKVKSEDKTKAEDKPKAEKIPNIRRCVKCKSAPTKIMTLGGKDFCPYCYEELRRKDRKLFNKYVNIDLNNSSKY